MNKVNKARGYDIRIYRSDSDQLEKIHAWGLNGALPQEWHQIKRQPNVKSARIFLSSQRRIRANKRKYVDQFTREVSSS